MIEFHLPNAATAGPFGGSSRGTHDQRSLQDLPERRSGAPERVSHYRQSHVRPARTERSGQEHAHAHDRHLTGSRFGIDSTGRARRARAEERSPKLRGYLPQEFGVYPKLPAIDMLHHLAVLKGVTAAGE